MPVHKLCEHLAIKVLSLFCEADYLRQQWWWRARPNLRGQKLPLPSPLLPVQVHPTLELSARSRLQLSGYPPFTVIQLHRIWNGGRTHKKASFHLAQVSFSSPQVLGREIDMVPDNAYQAPWIHSILQWLLMCALGSSQWTGTSVTHVLVPKSQLHSWSYPLRRKWLTKDTVVRYY